MSKLFEVTVEATFYILAKDENEADAKAEFAFEAGIIDGGITPDCVVHGPILTLAEVEAGWRHALPYIDEGNGADDMTIEQLFAEKVLP